MTAYVELQCNGWLRGDWQPILPCSQRYGVQEPTSLHQARGRASEDGWSSEVVRDVTTAQPMWIDLCDSCTRDRRPPLLRTVAQSGATVRLRSDPPGGVKNAATGGEGGST